MEEKTTNVFILGTEYHFIVSMCIIEQYFHTENYTNRLVLLGKRLSQLSVDSLPKGFEVIPFVLDEVAHPEETIHNKILAGTVANVFAVHTHRAPDTLILSKVNKKTTIVHLYQDGALFYNRIEKNLLSDRLKQVLNIYKTLWRKGVYFTKPVWFGRFIEESAIVDEIWMTHPTYYIGPATRKPVHVIEYFKPSEALRFWRYFNELPPENLQNALIYLAPLMRKEDRANRELDEIEKLRKKFPHKTLLIKVHPNTYPFHIEGLRKHYGDQVIKNYVPAELYFALATDSTIVACASTSLFYQNPSCRYFALKSYYQEIDLYDAVYNVQLPDYVQPLRLD
jgi:hypothetical protein